MEVILKMTQEKGFSIYGIKIQYFILISIIILTCSYLNILPSGMVGAFPYMIIIGAVLGLIGDNTPIIKDYLGGGPIVIIFGAAALVYFNAIPESSIKIVTDFMKGQSFLDFYIAALITGSILGMDRNLLIKASIRYLPAILGGVICAVIFAGLLGAVIGFGAKQAILYIAVPIMGGGMGAGAVPLSQIYGESMNNDSANVLSMMVPAVALGNAMAIVCGGILNKIGNKYPKLTGNGQLMLVSEKLVVEKQTKNEPIVLSDLGIGILLSTSFFAFGVIVGKLIPSIHSYAWMIIAVGICKATGVIPEKYEKACFNWFQFIMLNLTSALLVGIGIAYTDLREVIDAFSLQYILIVAATVIGSIIGSGFIGKFVGFYPIESAITSGLCMANMGGTGDVAVLSASKRMMLMPFAQISSRIGGAFMLILATIILKIIA
jgi:malate:Na+ symporter